MRIVILGAGSVGFNLADALERDHDVTVIERRRAQLDRLRDRLDVSVVEGDGTSAATLLDAGVPDANRFIAVTEDDSVNMVACTLAHALGKGHELGHGKRIARVRNPDFAGRNPVVPKRTFGISRIIDPDEVTVRELADAIIAGVTDASEFADGEILLRGTILEAGSPFIGMPLQDLRQRRQDVPFLIAAIIRDDEMMIPQGDTQLIEKDHIFVILGREALPQFRKLVSGVDREVEHVVIYGAARIGLRLAETLEQRGVAQVVLVEEDLELVERAAERLDRTLVLHGDISDPKILADASVDRADYFIATSHRDEMNLIATSLVGRGQQGPRRGVVTANPDLVSAISGFDLDLVVNERLITVEAILRFIRSGRYLSVKRLNEQGAEITELSVQKESKADGKALRDLKLPVGSLVVAIHRDGQAILPTGESEVHSGDSVVLVAQPKVQEKAADLFFNPRWRELQERHRR